MPISYRRKKCGLAFLHEQPKGVFPQMVTDVVCPTCKAVQDDYDRSRNVEPTKGRFTAQGSDRAENNDSHEWESTPDGVAAPLARIMPR